MDFLNPAENPTGFTVFTIGITLLIIVASFVWRFKWQKGLLTGGMEEGHSATGIITGIGQTGTYINDQPRMTFTVQVQPSLGGAPYTAEIKQTIPHMALGMLAPGRQVALLVDPKKPSKVKIDIQGTANLATMAGLAGAAGPGAGFGGPGMGPGMPAGAGFGSPGMAMPGMPGAAPPPGGMAPGFAAAAPGMPTSLGGAPVAGVRSNDELVRSTDAVPATVTAVQETGQSYGSDPLVILTLQVQAPSGAYAVQGGYRVPLDRRPRLMPGVVVRAHPDPANPQAVGIDWNAL
jgi:hypothetical protein